MANKSSKAARGAGNIRKKTVTRNGKNYEYWEARVTIGRDPGTGRQKQRSVSGKTQAEVLKKLQEIEVDINSGDYTDPCKLTVKEWLETWENTYLGSVKPNTVSQYREAIDQYIVPAIGGIKLQSLTAPTIQKMINDMSAKGLSAGTVKWVKSILSGALAQAVRVDYLKKNPAKVVTLPRQTKKEMRPFDDAETAAFLKKIQGHRFETLFKFALFTGVRKGEAMGLTWDDVDFQKGTVTIRHQLQWMRDAHEYALISPKNGRTRVITMAPSVIAILRQQQIYQAEMHLKHGPVWTDTGFVFTNSTGFPLAPATVFRDLKGIVEDMGIPEFRFHDLRHTYAVAGLRAGIDPKTISQNLGHATVAFTLDIYAHVTQEMQMTAADKLEQYIQNVSNM